MFTNLNVFKMAHAMATHAGQRQAVVAQNLANADTPGYGARDISDFRDLVDASGSTRMRSTRAGHLSGQVGQPETRLTGPTGGTANTVSVEEEMLKAVETTRQHDRALAIYKSSLRVLRSSIG